MGLKYSYFFNGIGFHEAAEKIIPDSLFDEDDDFRWFSPCVVNLGFACEMYLKSIISDGIAEIHGHDLSKLFMMLQETDKAIIVEKMEKASTDDFYEILEEMKIVYIEWRYYFEKGKQHSVYMCFLEHFANTLRECAEEHLKEKTDTIIR